MTSDDHIDPAALIEDQVGYPHGITPEDRESHARVIASWIMSRLQTGDKAADEHVRGMIQSYYSKAIYGYVTRLRTSALVNRKTHEVTTTSSFRGVRQRDATGTLSRHVQLTLWFEMSIADFRQMIADRVKEQDIESRKLAIFMDVDKLLEEAGRPDSESVKDGLAAAGHSYTEFEIDEQAMGQ